MSQITRAATAVGQTFKKYITFSSSPNDRVFKQIWESQSSYAVPVRDSWSQLHRPRKELIEVYKVHETKFGSTDDTMSMRALLVVGLLMLYILHKNFTKLLNLNEEKRIRDGEDVLNPTTQTILIGTRPLLVLGAVVSVFFCTAKPSRTVHSILVDPHTKYVIYECGRFWGRMPTYYIFNGKEHERSRQYLSIARADEIDGNKKSTMKVQANDRFEHHFDQASSLVFANHRPSIVMPKVLALMGEAPKVMRSLNIPLEGEFNLTAKEAARVMSPLLKENLQQIYKLKVDYDLPVRPTPPNATSRKIRNNVVGPFATIAVLCLLVFTNSDLFTDTPLESLTRVANYRVAQWCRQRMWFFAEQKKSERNENVQDSWK